MMFRATSCKEIKGGRPDRIMVSHIHKEITVAAFSNSLYHKPAHALPKTMQRSCRHTTYHMKWCHMAKRLKSTTFKSSISFCASFSSLCATTTACNHNQKSHVSGSFIRRLQPLYKNRSTCVSRFQIISASDPKSQIQACSILHQVFQVPTLSKITWKVFALAREPSLVPEDFHDQSKRSVGSLNLLHATTTSGSKRD